MNFLTHTFACLILAQFPIIAAPANGAGSGTTPPQEQETASNTAKTHLAEYLFSLSPVAEGRALPLSFQNERAVISWFGVPEIDYTLEYSSDMNSWQSTGWTGTPENEHVTADVDSLYRANPSAFFRLGLKSSDRDLDGLSFIQESLRDTDPSSSDSDDDGISDADEIAAGSDPNADSSTPSLPRGRLPAIDRFQHSDWLNVEDFGACGTDFTDDTAAIQAALDEAFKPGNGNFNPAIYIPAGVYLISETLVVEGEVGGAIYGHGRDTVLKWIGPAGDPNAPSNLEGVMFHSAGWKAAIMSGITWNGNNLAKIGINHRVARNRTFENKNRHEYEAFLNFTFAGIACNSPDKASSELQYRYCLFKNCGRGISIEFFNYYNHAVDGCEFYNCDYGIFANMISARNCRFEGSTVSDLHLTRIHGNSVRRSLSINSRQFLSGEDVMVEDCWVDSWKNPDCAIELAASNKSTSLVFDCRFTNPPTNAKPPIKLNQGRKFLLSNNAWDQPGRIWDGRGAIDVFEIPAGSLPPPPIDIARTFIPATVTMPTVVHDVSDFYMNPDGTLRTDTEAVQACVDAARISGNGAMAYLPPGKYDITRPISVTGENYTISGSSTTTELDISEPHAAFRVSDPVNICIQHVRARETNSLILVEQVNESSASPSMATYDNLHGRVICRDLGAEDSVNVIRSIGFTADNCSEATILVSFVDIDILVEGEYTATKTGFIGVLSANAGLRVENNQTVTISDHYIEDWQPVNIPRQPEGDSPIQLNGDSISSPGRVVVGGFKLHSIQSRPPQVGEDPANYNQPIQQVKNYKGEFLYACGDFFSSHQPSDGHVVLHTGSDPVEIMVLGGTSTREPVNFSTESGASVTSIIQDVTSLTTPTDLPIDQVPDLQKIGGALDAFRELGALDTSFNHPWTGTTSAGPTAYDYSDVSPDPQELPVISGLNMHLRADRGIRSSGTGVTSWQAGGIRNILAKQYDSSLKPQLVQNTINGHPAVRFNETQTTPADYMELDDFEFQAEGSLFIVYQDSGTGGYLLSWMRDNEGMAWKSEPDRFQARPRFTSGGAQELSSPTLPSTTNPRLGEFHYISGSGSSSFDVSLNGNTFSDTRTVEFQNVPGRTKRPRLGSRSGSTRFLHGDIAEIIWYGRRLDNTEEAQVINYLNSRYNLSQ